MIKATMSNPIDHYNPIAIFGLKPLPEVSELRLLVKSRYCDLDLANSVAYFYLELTDGTNNFIVRCRYYEWLAAQDADCVYCKYIKVQQNNKFLNVLEISRIPKTKLSFCDINEKVNPLANGNMLIQREYIMLQREMLDITRVLNKQSDVLCDGVGTATLKNGLYVRATAKMKNLFSMGRTGIQYRYLNINQKIITDLEVFIDA